jgi:hypothetical protein
MGGFKPHLFLLYPSTLLNKHSIRMKYAYEPLHICPKNNMVTLKRSRELYSFSLKMERQYPSPVFQT